MKSKLMQVLAFSLALVMLLSCFAGCGESNENGKDTGNAESGTGENETENGSVS